MLLKLWNEIRTHKLLTAQLALGVILALLIVRVERDVRPASTTTVATAPAAASTVVHNGELRQRDILSTFVAADTPVVTKALASVGKATPLALVVATSAETATGGGKFTTEVLATPPAEVDPTTTTAPPTASPVFTGLHFSDWRLTFDADFAQQSATYALKQTFESVITTGRKADGTPIATAQLYELDAQGTRVPVPTVATTAVFADATVAHWLHKVAIQAGVAETRSATGAASTGGLVALQWLKHGRTPDAPEVTYAVLSPALVVAAGVTDIGILPVSVNLGRRVPGLSNLWLSPFISRSQRLGVSITATF